MLLAPPSRSSVLLRRYVRVVVDLFVPQPGHHQLQVWRFDALASGRSEIAARHTPFASAAKRDAAGGHLSEHGIGKHRFDRDGRFICRERLIEPFDRFDDRVVRLAAVEVIDAQVVVEQVRDAALEEVELRDRVLTHRHQKADAQVAAIDGAGKFDGEGVVTVLGTVVEKVFLELIEDDHQVAVDRRGCRPQTVLERRAVDRVADLLGDGEIQAADRVVAPVSKDDEGEIGDAALGAGVGSLPHADRARRRRSGQSSCRRRSARTSSVSRDAIRLAAMILRSSSRPKKNSACSSVKGIKPE